MARNLPQLTVKATGKLNRGGLQRLKDVLELQRNLYNSCLLWLRYRPITDRYILRDLLRKNLTEVRRDDTDYWNILWNMSDGTLQRAITNHLRHVAPKKGTKTAGRPRIKSEERFRTLTLLSPDNDVIFPTKNGLKLKTKGLPNIKLRSSQKIPVDRKPSAVHITLKRGMVHLRLVYDQPRHPPLKTRSQVKNALGIDLGVAVSIAASNGLTYISPDEEKLYGQLKRAQGKVQRAIAAAIRLGRCGFKAVLDHHNKQVLTSRDRPRRELVWLKEPTRSYLKARNALSRLYDRMNQLRHDFRHRVTTEIVKAALAQGTDLIAVEELNIPGMTTSARGTAEKHGRNVKSKSGLNRAILKQGWGEIIQMLAYKARKAGIRFISVWPGRSSQTCSHCSTVDARSRRSQEHFLCATCGHDDNADLNASKVIAQRGLKLLGGKATAAA